MMGRKKKILHRQRTEKRTRRFPPGEVGYLIERAQNNRKGKQSKISRLVPFSNKREEASSFRPRGCQLAVLRISIVDRSIQTSSYLIVSLMFMKLSCLSCSRMCVRLRVFLPDSASIGHIVCIHLIVSLYPECDLFSPFKELVHHLSFETRYNGYYCTRDC